MPPESCLDRRSAPDGATVLIIETVLDHRRERDPAKTLDIVMLARTGGRERTPARSRCLSRLGSSSASPAYPTGGGVQLVEARAVAVSSTCGCVSSAAPTQQSPQATVNHVRSLHPSVHRSDRAFANVTAVGSGG